MGCYGEPSRCVCARCGEFWFRFDTLRTTYDVIRQDVDRRINNPVGRDGRAHRGPAPAAARG